MSTSKNCENPFEVQLAFEIDDEESIDSVINGIKQANRIAWQHTTILQWLVSLIPEIKIEFRKVVYEYDEDTDTFYCGPERRQKSRFYEQTALDRLLSTVKTRVRHHMMPRTIKIQKIDEVA